jgi:hypothetical protein
MVATVYMCIMHVTHVGLLPGTGTGLHSRMPEKPGVEIPLFFAIRKFEFSEFSNLKHKQY